MLNRRVLYANKALVVVRRLCQGLTEGERKLTAILQRKFPNAAIVQVQDISGGCGSMYGVNVVANDFKKLSLVKQHKLVTDALKSEIPDMHGIRISTKVPENQ